MMPVTDVQAAADAGRLVLRKGLKSRAALFHARDDRHLQAICGFVPSEGWSDDYARDGGGVCHHCRAQLRRAGLAVSMMGRIVDGGES
jgi:hypothetical protein